MQTQPDFVRQAMSSLLLNTKNDVALKKWMSELESEVAKSERRSLPLEFNNRDFVAATSTCYKPPTCSTRPSRRNEHDLAIQEMRSRLYAFVHLRLTSLLSSPLKLADFRLALVYRLRSTENDSVEQFVLAMFDFFSVNCFGNLLAEVKIEWSYRLKS